MKLTNLILAFPLCFVLLFGTTACNVEDHATPEQAAALEENDLEMAQLEGMFDQTMKAILGLSQDIKDSATAGDAAAVQDSLRQFGSMVSHLEEIHAGWQEVAEESAEIEQEVTKQQRDSFGILVNEFVPDGPWKVAALGVATLGSRLLTRRGRRHLGKAAKSASMLQGLDMVKSLLAATGYGSGSTADALESVRDVAAKEGKLDLAVKAQAAQQEDAGTPPPPTV